MRTHFKRKALKGQMFFIYFGIMNDDSFYKEAFLKSGIKASHHDSFD
jgi:hypothetical protein